VRPLLIHSETQDSILVGGSQQQQRPRDPVEEFMSKFAHLPPTQIFPDHVWICSSTDLSWISKVNAKMLEPINFFDCPSANSVRALLQAIIGKIQNLLVYLNI
jgi:hypothetical protein